LGEPRGDLRACSLFHYFTLLFSTPTLPLRIFNTPLHPEMQELSIEILKTMLFAHPKEKTRSKVRKNPHLFLQKVAQFSLFFILFSTSTLLICILIVSLHSETHQLSNDVLTFTKFALLQEKKRFKVMNPHLYYCKSENFSSCIIQCDQHI
jgi:hypothetical protein